MGRRIDVELTSKREDGRWTWRAAGAKNPRGEVEAALLYEGAKIGDVVRAEADFEIEGILITSVLAPKEKKRSEPERVEMIGPPRDERGVTSTLTGKPERGGPDRPRRGDDTRRGPRGDGPPRSGQGRPDDRGRGDRSPRPALGRPDTPAPAPRVKKLNPGHAHRDAVLAALAPEQRPIAEQALRGGLPGVRQAMEAQNAALREAGQAEVNAGPLVAMAEQLLPQLKAAEWRDRAEAAVEMVDDLSMRDLRSLVTGADTARDDAGRLLAGTLRDALDRRLRKQRESWIAEITAALEDGRLVQALRASARPPDPGSRFPAELAMRLSEAAGTAMAPDAPADRWQALLEAVVDSPVRRSVKPAGLPSEAPEQLFQVARQASGKVPALAALLGISMPPPPGPPRPVRAGAGRPHRSGPRSGAPIPPPPPAPAPAPPPAP
ncbi:MAG TPA: hypothetical protein VM142_08590 [Acidimicrobiales bacterium]|nr:hypothetical protein [Acidimicrobiales bacterium]